MVRLAITLLTLWLTPLAFSQVIDKEVEAKGYGDDYPSALAAALFTGYSQVHGAQVGIDRNFALEMEHHSNDDRETLKARIGVEQNVFLLSKGRIRSYRVTKIEPGNKQSQWLVQAQVSIPVYQTLKDQRKSVTLTPFLTPNGPRVNTPAQSRLSQYLSDGIGSNLVQSAKLAVINRDFKNQMQDEQRLLASQLVSATEAARLGNIAGSDYIVVGKIYQAITEKEDKDFYGANFSEHEDSFEIFYQVVDVASQKILWSNQDRYLMKRQDQPFADSIKQLSSTIAKEILNAIYPLKVVKNSGENWIFLNQGQEQLSTGMLYQVYDADKNISDLDSHATIQLRGKAQAQIEITEVLADHAIAKVIQGNGKDITEDSILQLLPAKTTADNTPKRELTPGSSEKPIQW